MNLGFKVGDVVEIIGLVDTRSSTVTGLEMFQKTLDESLAGDNCGMLLRGIQKTDIQVCNLLLIPTREYSEFGDFAERNGFGQAWIHQAPHQIRLQCLYSQEGRGRKTLSLLQGLQAPILHENN